MEYIKIAGIEIPVREMKREELQGILVDDMLRYRFYEFSFQGVRMLLLVTIASKEPPAQSKRRALRLSSLFGAPIVFFFEHMDYYERMRMIEKQVFYVVGESNSFLPNLISSSLPKRKKPEHLSASAQYLIILHLQNQSLEEMTLSYLSDNTPYTYVSIAKAFQNLEDLGLAESRRLNDGVKMIHFLHYGKELWDAARAYMRSPVKETFYCDNLDFSLYPESGLSALSFYSNLANDDIPTIAVYARDFNKTTISGLNQFDGNYAIEVWRYPSLWQDRVDPLSLYLSLENNKDPRVRKELDNMFDSVWK